MEQVNAQSTKWAIAHIRSYLDGQIDVEEFSKPIPQITDFYKDYPNEPTNRLAYFWQEVAKDAMSITRLGHPENETDFKVYLERWLDALQRPDHEWKEIVRRKGRALEHNVPNWDK